MIIPTEPIGSIPRPPGLIQAIAASGDRIPDLYADHVAARSIELGLKAKK
jgi:hypothetical protein